MPRRVSIDKTLGGARKVPAKGDLGPPLLDEFIEVICESRDTSFTGDERAELSAKIKAITHEYALDQHRERPIPIEQIRQELKDYLRTQRRIGSKRLNRQQREIASRINWAKSTLDQGLTSTAAYQLAIEHLEDSGDPEAAAEKALEQLGKGVPGRPNHRALDAEFISKVRQACADHGVTIEGRFHTKEIMPIHALYECIQHLRSRRMTDEAFLHVWKASSPPLEKDMKKAKRGCICL